MTRSLEPEPQLMKPRDFDAWLLQIGMTADAAGAWAVVGAWMRSPEDCCRYLVSLPGLWEGLIARGRYADQRRYEEGVMIGRRAGL